jgi:hypothetical protein
VILALSPYHLTTRELPAVASLLLASRVVTFMPGVFRADGTSPRGGRADVHAHAATSARYARLVDSWRWSQPLWSEGLIDSSHAGDDAAGDVRTVWDRMTQDERYAALRPFVRHTFAEGGGDLIEAAAKDVLKGGPDPSIAVPILAGLDRFAARHNLVVARAEPASVAQRAEADLARPLARVVIPMLTQASAEAIMDARDALAAELDDLRAAFASLAALGTDQPEPDASALARPAADLKRAALAYDAAFSRAYPLLEAGRDRDEVSLRAAPVSLALGRLPADAVLRSSCAAARSILGPGTRPPACSPTATSTLPVLADALDQGVIATIIFRPLGRSAPARAR